MIPVCSIIHLGNILLITYQVFGVPQNFSIPSSSQNTFRTQLLVSGDIDVVFVMSDATGFGTGGTSQLLTVGSSLGGQCNPDIQGVAFTFSLNTVLQQCL
jgi:hypothetical protein